MIQENFQVTLDYFSDISDLPVDLNCYDMLISDTSDFARLQSRFIGIYLLILDSGQDLPELEYVENNSTYFIQRPLKNNLLKQIFRSIGHNLHTRNRAEQITKLHHQLQQESIDALIHCNAKGKIYFVNTQFSRLVGKSKNDIMGLRIQDIFKVKQELDFEKIKIALHRNSHVLGECSYQANFERKQFLEFSFYKLDDGQENYAFLFHNITRRRQMEGLLRKRLSFESLITDIAKNFMGSDDLDLSFNFALIELSQFCGAEVIELWFLNNVKWERFLPKVNSFNTNEATKFTPKEVAQLFDDGVEQMSGESRIQAIPYYALSLGLDSEFPAYLVFFQLENRGFLDDPLLVNMVKEIFHHAFIRKNSELERSNLMKAMSDQLMQLQTIISFGELFRSPSELYLEQVKSGLELLHRVFHPRDTGLHIHIDDWSWTKTQSSVVLDTFHYLFSGKVSGPGTLEITANFNFSEQDLDFLTLIAQEIDRYVNQNRLKKERDLMEIQLLHSQKVEAMGQLAAGIAHEINTPNQYIRDNIIFLRQVLTQSIPLFKSIRTIVYKLQRKEKISDEELQKFNSDLQKIEPRYLIHELPRAISQSLEGLSQVNHIITSMRIYSHGSQGKKSLAQLNDIISSAITVCRNQWKTHAELETHFSPHLPDIPCIVGELSQVFVNIIMNSTHAIESFNKSNDRLKGLIHISTMTYEDWIEVRIKDNGTGISVDDRDHIFDLFYSTKNPGEGTGQGLAIAQEIIKNHHDGEIFFFSLPNHGAEFRIRLPVQV